MTKRSRGRPPKTKGDDIQGIIKKIEEQTGDFSAKCADNLDTLFDVVYTTATSEKSPLKDKLASAKYCIEQAEKFLKKEEEKNKLLEEEEGRFDDELEEEPKGEVISLKAVD